jgi:protocatechuate 3,4-dioxygenase beta subunit
MKTLVRCAIVVTLIVSSVICLVAQKPSTSNKKVPSGQVSGRVTVRGKPAAGVAINVRVKKSNSWSDTQSTATTDEDGKYHIDGLSAGTYAIAPIAWTFVSAEPEDSGWIGKQVVVSEDESIENLDFTLVRGGVITGKVTDANGRPVIEELVNLILANQGRPFSSGVLTFQTDDRGIYRMFGLPAGPYKVSVGQGDDELGNGRRGRIPYRKTYFPDATDPAKAKVVELAEGAEATNIDITVAQKVHSFSATGRVVDGETGKPMPNMMINLTRTVFIDANSSSSGGGGPGINSNHQGEFKIENLVPGHYSLSIFPPSGSDLRADSVAFDVVDHDVTELRIKTAAGASVEGMVVLEGSHDSSVAAKLAQFHLMARIVEDNNKHSYGQSSRIAADGKFRIGGLQVGNVKFLLGGDEQVRGFVIVRIERDGAVQPNGIQLQNGEHLTGVRVVVAYGTATIRGTVKLENGTLPVGAHLTIQLKKSSDPPFSEGAAIDSRGRFVIERLLPGNYELTLYLFGSSIPPQRPRSVKQTVNVAEGSVTEVMMTMDLKQNPALTPGRP